MSVSIENYQKALNALEVALAAEKSDLHRDATIQRFEFCVELAWKTGRKLMGTATTAPKDVLREMAQNGYIHDIKAWLLAVDRRNLSSHAYDEDLAEEVYAFTQTFLPLAQELLKNFQTATNIK